MDASRRMSHLDGALFSLETATAHMQLGMVAVFSNDADVDADTLGKNVCALFRERIGEKATGFPELRLVARPQLGGLVPPILIDSADPLDFDYHITAENLSELGGRFGTGDDAALHAWAAREMAMGLEFRRPLWRIMIATGLHENRFAVLFKAHHSVFDGMAALRIALDLMENRPRQARRRRRVKPGVTTTLGSCAQLAMFPVRAVRLLVGSLLHGERIQSSDRALQAFRAPRTIVNGVIGDERVVNKAELSLEAVSSVRRDANTTATDVLITVASLSLSRALKRRNALPQKPLVAFIPVAQSGTEWAKRSGNRLGVWFVSMATDVVSVDERLRSVADSSRRARIDLRTRGADIWDRLAGVVPPVLLHNSFVLAETFNIFRVIRPLATVVLSNVAGPREALRFAGGQLQSIIPLGPVTSGALLNITMVSVGDTLHVGVFADASMAEVAKEVARDLPTDLDELVAMYEPDAG